MLEKIKTKKQTKLLRAGLFFLALLPLSAQAQTNNALLSGPEVYKLDWNTRALQSHDMDSNGSMDMVLLNNEKTRIEILYQNRPDLKRQNQSQQKIWHPILEDSRFSRNNVVTGVKMNAMAIGDLNSDGLPDLVFTSNTFGLSLLYQKANNQWAAPKHIDYVQPSKNTSSLAISDLNLDGNPDLVLLGEDQLMVFYQNASRQFELPQRYPLVNNNHFSLKLHDVNNDQRADIIYLVKNSRFALRLRLQNSDGSFGPEQLYPMHSPRNEFALVRQADAAKKDLVYIENQSNQLVLGQFSQSQANNDNLPFPDVYPLPFKDVKAGNYAGGDLNGDGLEDIVVADFKGAQVWLYLQLSNGQFAKPVAFPSFSGVQSISLADLDSDNADELYLVSKTEKLLGVSRFIDNRQISYPAPVLQSNNTTPILLANIHIHSNAKPALVHLEKDKQNRQLKLSTYDQTSRQYTTQQTLPLKNLKQDPSGIKVVDINQDGKDDLILFILHKPALVILQTEQGQFEQLSGQNLRQGLLDNLKTGSLTLGDINNNKKADILLAAKGYARAIHSNSQGQLEIKEQYNAVNKSALVGSILPLDVDGDKQVEMLVYQQRSEKIDVLKLDRNNVYRPFQSIPSGAIDIVDSRLFETHQNGEKRILYMGKDRFWILGLDSSRVDFNILSRYESGLPDTYYQKVISADIENNLADIVILDSQSSRIVELLSRNNSSWKSRFHFEVFDTQSVSQDSRGSSNEPRELLLSDINGDKKNDLIFLVHDRILVYFGQ